MKRLVILGGGESGAGAAKLGKKLGYEVFLSDKGKLADKYNACWKNWAWSMKRDNTRKNVFSPQIWW